MDENALHIFDPTLTFLSGGRVKDLLKACIKYTSDKQITPTIIILHTDLVSHEELLDFRYVIGSWVTVLGDGRMHLSFKMGNKHRIQNIRIVENAGAINLTLDGEGRGQAMNPLSALAEQSTFNMKLTHEQAVQRQRVELPHCPHKSHPPMHHICLTVKGRTLRMSNKWIPRSSGMPHILDHDVRDFETRH